jgi:hypothetical protein
MAGSLADAYNSMVMYQGVIQGQIPYDQHNFDLSICNAVVMLLENAQSQSLGADTTVSSAPTAAASDTTSFVSPT